MANNFSGDFGLQGADRSELESLEASTQQLLNTIGERVSSVRAEITRLNQGLQKDFSDSIKGAIKNGTDFAGVFDKLKGTIEDFVIQMAVVNPALNALFGGNRASLGDTSGSDFPSGGIIGSIFSGITGLLEGRAAGGPVTTGTPYIVGERGPELFVPQTAGSIHPNVGGAVNITEGFKAWLNAIPQSLTELFGVVMLGYIGGRSWEKVKGVAR